MLAVTNCWKVVDPSAFTCTFGSANPRTPVIPKLTCGHRLVEICHTSHGAEVVIECSILLHEEDDMLDIGQRAGSRGRGEKER